MQKIWKFTPSDPGQQERLARDLNIPSIMAQLLINRGLSDPADAESFLRADLSSLGDPFLLPDMGKAVSRIKKAIENKETIAVYGDYDVDGLTSSALLTKALERLGAKKIINYLPNRLEDGYGLSIEGLKKLEEKNINLLISVDCGTNSQEEVKYLEDRGVDVIITDHHQPVEGMVPPAVAVVNPRLAHSLYPFQPLAGVGVVHRLVEALGVVETADLDLVCLGTISDIVPLLGENRILAKHGLLELAHTKRPGLKALIEVSRINTNKMNSGHVGFMIGPRLNAQGRLGSALEALNLLLTADPDEASRLAGDLDKQNRRRQKIESDTLKLVNAQLDREINFNRDGAIVLGGDGWHRGVLGICASRMADRYFRPTILLSFEGDEGRGSGRSVSGFHLYQAIKENAQHLEAFGGHKQACGITLKKEKFEDFREGFNKFARETFTAQRLAPYIDVEFEIKLSDLDERSVEVLEDLEPFGMGNPSPVFASSKLICRSDPITVGRGGIKFWVSDGTITYEALSFKHKEDIPLQLKDKEVDLAYKVNLNDWRGTKEIELRIETFKLS